jgi:hypothetical protein
MNTLTSTDLCSGRLPRRAPFAGSQQKILLSHSPRYFLQVSVFALSFLRFFWFLGFTNHG